MKNNVSLIHGLCRITKHSRRLGQMESMECWANIKLTFEIEYNTWLMPRYQA